MVKKVETWFRWLGGEDSPGERNGNPLHYSCLENPMDRGAWWATVRAWDCRELDMTEQLTLLSTTHANTQEQTSLNIAGKDWPSSWPTHNTENELVLTCLHLLSRETTLDAT